MADPVSLGITVALSAAQMALAMTRKIEGPRLDDLKVSVADYGTPLNYFYGLRRFDAVPIIWAENIREEKHRNKTKGGKYNDYKYFGTWAVAVADHEIAGITRIWFDKHLVYDATGTGPITPFSLGDGFAVSAHIRFYLGTEDQEPDPRMLATVEAAQGAGSCPAYRGVALIVFEEVPLEKVGNRIPQISVEAASATDTHYPLETLDPAIAAPVNSFGLSFSPDFSRIMWASMPDYEIWDVAARSPMVSGEIHDDVGGDPDQKMFGIANNGTIYGLTGGVGTNRIIAWPPDGVGAGVELVGGLLASDYLFVRQNGLGTEFICTIPLYPYLQYYVLGAVGGLISETTLSRTGVSFSPSTFFTDAHGDVWVAGGSATDLYLYRISDTGVRPGSTSFATVPGIDGDGAKIYHFTNTDVDHFVVSTAGGMFTVDIDSFAITNTRSAVAGTAQQWVSVRPGASSIYLDNVEISSIDLTTIRTLSANAWDGLGSDSFGTSALYDPTNHAIFHAKGGQIRWAYLDRIGSDGVLLSSIVDDVSARCGIDPADIDASDLDQVVPGYSWTQGAGKDILEPLLDAYCSIVRPHDFGVQFLKLGFSTSGTIETAQFVRKGDEPRYTVTIAQDTDLPRRVTFSFADKDKDQQTNSVPAQRPLDAVDGVRETLIDMTTLALDVDEARQLAERWFRMRWLERESVGNALTAQYLAIEPGDAKTLDLDGSAAAYRARKTVLRADGAISAEWVRYEPSFATLSGAEGATMDGRTDAVVTVPGISKGFVLDTPLIRDADNDVNPILYYGAAPYSPTVSFPGALIYQSSDGSDYDVEWANVPSTAALTWGYAAGALADANPNIWDRGNSVNVIVKNGTLVSTTEAVCNVTPTTNLALLGDELIQFTTATLQGDGSYTLTGLKRGRRGTEWACGDHAAGDRFILLDQVGNVEMGASDIGDTLYFKAATVGRDVDSAFPINIDPYTAASLKPYAPCQIEAVKDSATGDWTIDWTRRSRIGGAWTGGTSVPLGEASEAYEVDILDAPGGAVLHTYSVTSPTATFSAADQTAYAGGDVAEGDLFFEVYQISGVVDRGFAAEANF